MLTGTLVTAAGFLPVGLAQSSTGEYTRDIFRVVGLSLVLSWFVAVLFVPFLGAALLPAHRNRAERPDPTLRHAASTALCGGSVGWCMRPLAGDRRHRRWRSCFRWSALPGCRSSSFPPPTGWR